ncbi:hypothetical protein [Desulfitibacter alkalitolerans]|uniref:hypothetical protein n=1 Tax=Desulfitibacter alkalitolerans TaxID=264641 RepID=UPI0012EC8224|nr:hypothetical protein [Desulfitibacter alkalitolerans]
MEIKIKKLIKKIEQLEHFEHYICNEIKAEINVALAELQILTRKRTNIEFYDK